jgi:hypothetical protein
VLTGLSDACASSRPPELDDLAGYSLFGDGQLHRGAEFIVYSSHGIAGEMGVALRRGWHLVTEQLADHLQADATPCGQRCIAVTKIVKPDIIEPGVSTGDNPGATEILVRLIRLGPGDDVATDARSRFQDL